MEIPCINKVILSYLILWMALVKSLNCDRCLSLFSITPFPLFSKDRCESRKKISEKNSGFALRRILGVKHTCLAPRVPRRALRVFFVFFFFCVCLFLTLEIDFAAKE